MTYSLPKGHICNPPFTRTADKRWKCGACGKRYWYNAAKKRWELVT